MIRRISAAAALCLVLIFPGCKAVRYVAGIPGKIYRAGGESCEWRRTKIRPDAVYDVKDGRTESDWTAANLQNVEFRGELPYDVKVKMSRKDLRTGLLQEFAANGFERRVALKSEDKDWNGEVFFALDEKGKIVLSVDGPRKIIILTTLSISRDRDMTDVRKYIYKISDENGNEREVPVATTRARGMSFYGKAAESAGMPAVYVLEAPEGSHTYTITFEFNNDEGDILFKFLEPFKN
jgi:hypothetical protein